MSPSIVGVSEIVLSVDDLPAMREFYTTVMGMPLHSEACWTSDEAPDPEGLATISFLNQKKIRRPRCQSFDAKSFGLRNLARIVRL